MLSITICLSFAYHLCVTQNVDEFNLNAEDNSSAVDESFDQPKIWSDLLEEITIKLVKLGLLK